MTIDSRKTATVAAVAVLAAFLLAGVAILGARIEWWTADRGVFLMGIAVGIGAGAVVLALVAVGFAIRTRRGGLLLAVMSLFAAGGLIGFGLARQADEARWPPIHDVATDITDPVRFRTLTVTPNNVQDVPTRARSDLAGLTNDIKWRTWHVERYRDIRPIAVPSTVAQTMVRVRALALKRGWRIAAFDPAGRLEATDTSGLFAAKDDIAIAVRPATIGAGSVVSMRSVARGEGGDAGRNAMRIRRFLSDLKKG